ncbi:DUF5304 domain-containing protein [Streptomyces tsukubensis]|uniref:DUF5304 domain-containing protein n=1 Tax=Streptomyces tsukubensis TaxID=83656 RepID=A0A1V4A6J8_9ACTN|nr:DUF5304 domain-containing protein [Streptomyces tsukubensis]OON77662.1 hypothetical protein B1H18_18200 [Streptomyces tsukubensis]QFR93171.1 hypothetical protein GBW32_08835 [Streptomyces tsukubensis]
MSDPNERPAHDEDAWAEACAEDLAAEQARRRQRYGTPPGSAAEELRKLAETVAEKLTSFQGPAGSAATQQVVRQVVQQAKAVVDPVIERNPQVFDHLAAAGSELLAAYRSAVEGQESRWTRSDDDHVRPTGAGRRETTGDTEDDAGGTTGPTTSTGTETPRRDDEGPGRSDHIDLD